MKRKNSFVAHIKLTALAATAILLLSGFNDSTPTADKKIRLTITGSGTCDLIISGLIAGGNTGMPNPYPKKEQNLQPPYELDIPAYEYARCKAV
jgi:hypothetical protein